MTKMRCSPVKDRHFKRRHQHDKSVIDMSHDTITCISNYFCTEPSVFLSAQHKEMLSSLHVFALGGKLVTGLIITCCIMSATGNWSRDGVRKWLTTTVTAEDAKREPVLKAAEPLRRNPSGEDDLVLGVEASLYGGQGVRTVQEFLRWSRSSPALSRWNSFSSATSGHSGPLSVMDILNLWKDDPEEVLLDLGFGCDEPDLSGRIPARFINHQSRARGINLQVFLEAQKNRLDLENPDVSNRFRELEVLQQVTTAFSSLVGSSPSSPSSGKALPPEARERRRRVGMLFRRASKKSLSQIHSRKSQDLTTPAANASPCAAPESVQPPFSHGDKKVPLKRVKPGLLLETVCLSPLAEEQGAGPDLQPQPNVAPLIAHEGALRHGPLTEGHPMAANTFLLRKKSPGPTRESFEMEEIQSFDESSATGNYTGGAEHSARGVIRTNSCQSDSSGFLEEPFIPSLSQQASPAPDLIKALSGLSGGSSERPDSPSPSSPQTPPSLLLSSSMTGPSPQPLFVFSPSPSPVSPCLPKSDLCNSETETPPDQDESSPASLPASACEDLPPRSSSLEDVTHSRHPDLPSPATFISPSPTSAPMQLAPVIRGSEEIETEDKDAPPVHLSTVLHDSEGTGHSSCSSVPPPASSPSPSMSSPKSDSPSGSPGNSLSAACGLSSLPPSAPPDFHCPRFLASPPLSESLSQSGSPENNQKDSLIPDSDGIDLSDPPTDTQKEEEETPSSLSFQLDEDNPSAPSSPVLDSSELEERPPNPPVAVSQPALSSQSHDSDGLMDPAVGRISDQIEQSISQYDDTAEPAPASPVHDVIHVKTNHLSLDFEDTHQRNGKGAVKVERHADTVQTQEAAVYISDTESYAGLSEASRLVSKEVCNQTEIDPQLPSCSLHDELSTGTQPEESQREVVNGSESESLRSSSVLRDDVPETHSRTEVQPKDLIKIESLDLVFQTSVDDSESDYGDVDAFFQQLDTEGRAYWAEPIQVSNPTPGLEESARFEASDGSPDLPAVLDSSSSTARAMPLSSSRSMDTDQMSQNAMASSDTPSSLSLAPSPPPNATPDLKSLSRSVSVQMSSSPSSHIVHRKDVPYTTDSKRTFPPSVRPLDTSTPFRAVQSWTDLQLQRNTLTKKLSQGALHTAPEEVTVSTSGTETIQRPTLNFTSSQYDWQSQDCLSGMTRSNRTLSVSVDKGLWPDEDEEVDWNGHEDEEKLWEGNQTATIACCCSCDHQWTCCTQDKQHTLGDVPYSLDELEEMMLSLQQFRSVLSNMEEQLSEDQAAVYSALSDQDREKVQDIEELRRAVKQEARELEMQLNELAHHYDDSLKMKMHRLLEEQSLLCSQLFLPGRSPASSRTVATQSCLQPWIPPDDGSSRIPTADGSPWIPPANGSSRIPPADGSSRIPPADDSSRIPPADGPPCISPADGSSRIPPADGSSRIPQADGSSWIPPAVDSPRIPPADESSRIAPADDSSRIPSADGSSWIPPAGDSSWIPPADGSSWIPPADGSSWIPPADGSSWIPPADGSSWIPPADGSLSQSPPGSKCICEGLGCSPTKADKLDMMGFLQRVRT
ncbi:mucin-5AC isoform X2 [Sebastes umbrosus]|uniref:mucin-5AC isoform X2 n=1 Tax=Sebastes umbrosus TaxID=72105 RepID=UPI00189E0136|nr:mucin-5AC isoform X2 [Sebastes umbrosus]